MNINIQEVKEHQEMSEILLSYTKTTINKHHTRAPSSSDDSVLQVKPHQASRQWVEIKSWELSVCLKAWSYSSLDCLTSASSSSCGAQCSTEVSCMGAMYPPPCTVFNQHPWELGRPAWPEEQEERPVASQTPAGQDEPGGGLFRRWGQLCPPPLTQSHEEIPKPSGRDKLRL